MTATPPSSLTLPTAPSHPAHTLLARAHSPTTALRVFTDKVQHKPLHLRPTTTDQRALRRRIRQHKHRYHLSKQKPQPLSAKEKRSLGIYDLRKEDVKYEVYKGLNNLWNGYMLEVLNFTRDGKLVDGWETREVSAAQQGTLLASADFHGAEVEVVRCEDVGKVGFKGVVVRDTKFTFVIVMEGDRVRTVMKRGAVFRYVVTVGADAERGARKVVLEVNGDALEYRPVDRAGRKFKWHPFEV
jgi:ribonuclease P protein subunit POP4